MTSYVYSYFMTTTPVAEAYPETVTLPDHEGTLVKFDVYIPPDEVRQIVRSVASGIAAEAKKRKQAPRLVGVLFGAIVFLDALSIELNDLNVRHTTDTIHVTRYGSSMIGGNVDIHKDLDNPDITDEWVVIVEDIKEGGKTLEAAQGMFETRGASDVQIAVFLNKPNCSEVDFEADYIGRNIDDEFVIGFGLDLNGQGRDLLAVYIKNENT